MVSNQKAARLTFTFAPARVIFSRPDAHGSKTASWNQEDMRFAKGPSMCNEDGV